MVIENLIRISLDQATETGVCVIINDKIVLNEAWVTDTKKVGIKMEAVMYNINKKLEKLLDLYCGYPVFVTIEDIYDGINKKTYKELAKLQGSLMLTLMNHSVLFEIITPRKWKAEYGIGGGEIGKKQSKEVASKLLGEKVMNDNIADAICMCDYSNKYFKVSENAWWNAICVV